MHLGCFQWFYWYLASALFCCIELLFAALRRLAHLMAQQCEWNALWYEMTWLFTAFPPNTTRTGKWWLANGQILKQLLKDAIKWFSSHLSPTQREHSEPSVSVLDDSYPLRIRVIVDLMVLNNPRSERSLIVVNKNVEAWSVLWWEYYG